MAQDMRICVIISEIAISELKSDLWGPNFGHCSHIYVYNCMEYFQIFPAADDPIK
jgi:hypothetical protein